MGAVSKKDKALQKMIKQTDPKLLQEIADECVQSFGMGIHRQRNRTGQEAGQESSGALNGGPTESPEQLRDTFSQSLKVLEYCPVRKKQTPPIRSLSVVLTNDSTWNIVSSERTPISDVKNPISVRCERTKIFARRS